MQANISRFCGATALLLMTTCFSSVEGANAYPLITDPNAGGLAFDAMDIYSFGANYAIDDDAQLEGNQILSISQTGVVAGGTGAGFSIPLSNGENGID